MLLRCVQVQASQVEEYFQPIPADHELQLPSLPGGGMARL